MHPELCVGGAEKVLLDMLGNLDKNKYDVSLLLINPSVWDNKIPDYVKTSYMFSKNPRKLNSILARVYKFFMIFFPCVIWKFFGVKGKFDIAIAYQEPMIWYLPCTKAFTVSWVHTDYSALQWFPEVKQLRNKEGFLAKKIEKARLRLINSFDRVVFVAKSAIPGYIQKTSYNISKTRVLYNINNEALIKELSNEEIVEPQWSNYEGERLVVVGRIHSQKAMHRLIPLMLEIKKNNICARLFVVGDGPDREQLDKLIKENGLEDSIIILGFTNNPYKYIRQAKLLICSSLFEAYCTATKESIILETPFVTTLCSGMEEQIGGTKAGIIVANEDNSLSDAVIKVLKDDALYSAMKKDIKQRHLDLSDEKAIDNIDCFLQDCISGRV
jgi:glycosyltransferase involved in cell wall biosynthesis